MEFDFSFSAMNGDLQFVQTGYWGQQQNIENCWAIDQSTTVPEFPLPIQVQQDQVITNIGTSYSTEVASFSSQPPSWSMDSGFADKQVTTDDLSDFIDFDWSSVSPQPTPSPSDFVAWAFDQAISDEGSRWALSQDSTQSDCSFNQFAQCSTASSSAVISVPQPLTYTLTVLEPNFLVNKESANFNVIIERGRKVKAAPWTVSSFFILKFLSTHFHFSSFSAVL
jgi:hypothetical protein